MISKYDSSNTCFLCVCLVRFLDNYKIFLVELPILWIVWFFLRFFLYFFVDYLFIEGLCNILGKNDVFYYFQITLKCAYYELNLVAKRVTNTDLVSFVQLVGLII